jgi:hypothetical protein
MTWQNIPRLVMEYSTMSHVRFVVESTMIYLILNMDLTNIAINSNIM